MREVNFAACLDSEVAWESDGHGEFTVRAARILGAGIVGLTNIQFVERVTADFGAQARQHPLLDCGPDLGRHRLLQPLIRRGAVASSQSASSSSSSGCSVDAALLSSTLESIQQLLTQLAGK